jgi:hypothetical protein
MIEEASSYPVEQFTDRLVTSAHSEPCATEEAWLYLTKEFTEGLLNLASSGPSTIEEASSYPTEEHADGLATSVAPDTGSPETLDGLGISAANAMVGLRGPL